MVRYFVRIACVGMLAVGAGQALGQVNGGTVVQPVPSNIQPAVQSTVQPIQTSQAVQTAQPGCGVDGGGCNSCGQPGGYFQNINDCGCGDGGCSTGGCGIGSRLRGGSMGSRIGGQGFLSRLVGLIPSIDLTIGNNCNPRKYRSFFAGGVEVDDYSGIVGGNLVTGSFRDGFILGTAQGQYLNDCTRIEMEGSWRNNSGDIWTNGTAQTAFDGHFNVFSTMFNVIRELNVARNIGLYVGGGIGFSKQDGNFNVNGANFSLDDWAFAYQGILGVNVLQTQCSQLFVEYRYLGNTQTDLEANGAFFDDFTYESQNIVFGFRINR